MSALPDASRECFGSKLDTLIKCLPQSPFKEALIDEIRELRQASRKQALEESESVARDMYILGGTSDEAADSIKKLGEEK